MVTNTVEAGPWEDHSSRQHCGRSRPSGGQAPNKARTSGSGRRRQFEGHVKWKARGVAASILGSNLLLPTPTLPDQPLPGPPSDPQCFHTRCLGPRAWL